MEIVTNYFNTVLADHGAFAAFLLLSELALIVACVSLWKDNKSLVNTMLKVVQDNVKVMTEIKGKLDEHLHDDNNKPN